MSVIQARIAKQNYVYGNHRVSGKVVAMKEHQAVEHHHLQRVVTDVMAPTPNANSLNNGSQIKYYLEKDTLRHLDSVTLRFQIQMDTANGLMMPTPYWFDRIEFYIRHNGVEIVRYYSDMLMLMLTLVEQEQSDAWANMVGYDPATYKWNAARIQNAGTTRYYYLPLPANVLESLDIDVSTLDGDIEIRLHPSNDGPLNGAQSVAGANPQLIELAGIYQEAKPDAISDVAHRRFLINHVSKHNYVDTQQYVITGRTINANNKYEYDLDQFDHLSAGLVVCIRANGANNVLGTTQDYASLGDGGIDVLGVSGESAFGSGRTVRADYLKDIIVAQHWSTSFIRTNNMYVIPFGNIEHAFHGIVDGVMKFDGTKMRLEITTPANWVNGNFDVIIYSIYFRHISQNIGKLHVADHK